MLCGCIGCCCGYYIDLECTNISGYFKTAGSATNIIENSQIFRIKSGGGTTAPFVATKTTDNVTGQTGTTITVATYVMASKVQFYRNGQKMHTVVSFSSDPNLAAAEYQEASTTTITLNSISPAVADDIFEYFSVS